MREKIKNIHKLPSYYSVMVLSQTVRIQTEISFDVLKNVNSYYTYYNNYYYLSEYVTINFNHLIKLLLQHYVAIRYIHTHAD